MGAGLHDQFSVAKACTPQPAASLFCCVACRFLAQVALGLKRPVSCPVAGVQVEAVLALCSTA